MNCRRIIILCSLLLLGSMAFGQIERGAPLPRKALLGAQLTSMTPERAKQLNVPAASIEVTRVIPGTTAEGMKFEVGDVVLSLNGKKTATAPEFMLMMRQVNGGQMVKVGVMRNGKNLELSGTAIERPKQKGDGVVVEYDQLLSLGKRIRVISTHPQGAGPFPTIFWIGGIGAYSLDAEYPNIAYGNIMGPLSKDYAIVRIDKPGQGDSEGPEYLNLGFDTELDAYIQAIRLTKTYGFVDKNRIAIVGHSMGGVFGPLVAQTEKVAAIAACATIAKTWNEYMLENTRRQSLLGGASPEAVDQEMVEMGAVCHHLFFEQMKPADIARKYPALKARVNAMIPDGKTYSGVGIGFFQTLATKNLPGAWAKIDAKVAAIWGENDFISTRSDHEFIAEMMNKKHPGSAEFILVPHSDHGFSNTDSFADSMQKWGRGGKFNPNIIEILSDWLKKAIGGG
ncbi:MAG: alpha/beta fold hydrolase [Armatimonadota bacterium]